MNIWDSKGIKTIRYLLNNNSNFYTFDRLKEIYGVRGTFLNYENILHKIPNLISRKRQILNHSPLSLLNKHITEVDSHKHLGMYFSNDGSGHKQIKKIVT